MGKIKPGRKSAACYVDEVDCQVLARWIAENKDREIGATLKDALRMVMIMGLSEMKACQASKDRMTRLKDEGHMWCNHLNVCGGMLTAPGEAAQRAHLKRDHEDIYTDVMSAAEVASHFHAMTD